MNAKDALRITETVNAKLLSSVREAAIDKIKKTALKGLRSFKMPLIRGEAQVSEQVKDEFANLGYAVKIHPINYNEKILEISW